LRNAMSRSQMAGGTLALFHREKIEDRSRARRSIEVQRYSGTSTL
jgi:hypothetical protein